MKIKLTLALTFLLFGYGLFAQDTLSVLFLGNSYTYCNNLPELVQSLSASAGKTLIVDSNTPGGCSIANHVHNATSIQKISQGTWNYIVIQEQSQIPTIDYYRYNMMYPAITELKSIAEQYNPCTRIITYMTWGRRFGGQQCDDGNVHCSPDFVDFNHMQDTLTSAYTEICDMLSMQCAPVGVSWQSVLNDTALLLHSGDNSHPNLDGSYLAALTIFSAIWKLPTSGLSFTAGLPEDRALYYQSKSDSTIFSNFTDWNLYINNPVADFEYSISGNTVTFTNTSSPSDSLLFLWNFGDGCTATDPNPVHSYQANGTYTVQLTVANCIFSDTATQSILIETNSTTENETSKFHLFPNPCSGQLNIVVDDFWTNSVFAITNLFGETVFSGTIIGKHTCIDLNHITNGIYFISIGRQTFSIIKYQALEKP